MATLSDWQTRKGRLDGQIGQLEELVNMYQQNTRATSDILKTVTELEEKVGKAQNRKRAAENAAATFDREFIERKETFPDPFQPSKLYTMQDLITFFLFISYCVFILALAVTFTTNALKIIIGGAILSGIFLILIFNYA